MRGRDQDRDLEQRAHALMTESLNLAPSQRSSFLRRRCAEDERLLQLSKALLEPSSDLLQRLDSSPLQGFWDDRDPEIETGTFGSYKLLRLLGEGGTSKVYLACSETLHGGQPVALKLLKRGLETDELARRFRREREVLESLRHPGIARLLGGGTSDRGRPYLVMDYIEGERLDHYCDRRQLGIGARIDLVRRVCRVVHHAHQRLIVHRDLKPANILVTRDRELALLDFGISKLLDPVSFQSATQTTAGLRRLTPVYASPEQFDGGPITTATDVYALGVLLFEMLTGQLPYAVTGVSASELEQIVRQVESLRPSAAVVSAGTVALRRELSGLRGLEPRWLARRLRGDLDTILLTALAKDPTQRYDSVRALASDLGHHLAGRPILARSGTAVYRLGKFLGRRRRELVAASSLLIVGLFFGLDRQASSREARQAKDQAARATSFLVEMLAAADPLDAAGGDISVREVLDRSVEEIDRLAEQPLLQAAVMHTLGRVYTSLGSYAEARQFLDRALDIRLDTHGERHIETAATLYQLSVLDRYDSHLAQARERGERALAIQRQLLRPPAPELARSLQHLGDTLTDLGIYAPAESNLRSALTMYQRLARNQPAIANAHLDLAVVLRDQERLTEATEHLQTAFEIWQRELGDDHLDLATGLSVLATVESRQGLHDQARRTQRRGLEMVHKLVGVEHPRAIRQAIELANQLRLEEDYPAAEALLLETLEISRRSLGEGKKETAEALLNLGVVMASQGRVRLAEDYYLQALDIQQELVGDGHFVTATLLNNIATARMMRGDIENGEVMLLRSLAAWRAVVGGRHPNIASILSNLGNLRFQQLDLDQAERYFLESLRIWELQEDGPHLGTTAAQQSLANVYIRRQDYSRAQELLQQALTVRIALLGESHSRVAVVLLSLGVACLDQGLWSESESYLNRALGIYRQTVAAKHQLLATTLQNLGKLKHLQGQFQAAESPMREAVSIYESTFGGGHRQTFSARSQLGEILGDQGRMREAEPHLVESYRALHAELGAADFRSKNALERLIAAYEINGQQAQATSYRELRVVEKGAEKQ